MDIYIYMYTYTHMHTYINAGRSNLFRVEVNDQAKFLPVEPRVAGGPFKAQTVFGRCYSFKTPRDIESEIAIDGWIDEQMHRWIEG